MTLRAGPPTLPPPLNVDFISYTIFILIQYYLIQYYLYYLIYTPSKQCQLIAYYEIFHSRLVGEAHLVKGQLRNKMTRAI